MMTYKDITFCSRTECDNKKCKRNQNNYDIPYDVYISIADFSGNCEYKFYDRKEA